jgi:hypothetical protein
MDQNQKFAVRRKLRPGSAQLLWAVAQNALASVVVLRLVLGIFGIEELLPEAAARFTHVHAGAQWHLAWALTPGAAACFGLLWFWLVVTGRSGKGVNWGAGAFYGVAIGILDVPAACLIEGLRLGFGLFGFLLGLIFMLLVPALTMSMIVYGLIFGVGNASFADKWIANRFRSRS